MATQRTLSFLPLQVGQPPIQPYTDHRQLFGSSLMNRLWSSSTKLAKMCYSVGEGGWQADRLLSDTSLSQSVLKTVQSSNRNRSNPAAYILSACLKKISVRTEIWVPKSFRQHILSLQLARQFQYRDPSFEQRLFYDFEIWHWCETAEAFVLHC